MKQAFQRFWSNVTAVHPSITDIEQRRSSKLLAMLFSYLIPVFSVVMLRPIVTGSGTIAFPSISLFILMLFAYGINRTGRYQLSANVWLYGASAIVVYDSFTAGTNPLPLIQFLIFLQAVLLLTFRSALILGVLSLVSIVFYLTHNPEPIPVRPSFLLSYVVLGGVIMVVFTRYRNRTEAEWRQQLININNALRQSESSLELRVKERTRDLEIATEVSRQITTMLDVDALLKAIADQTKEAFHLYHVSVFTFDLDQNQLTLAAGSGDIGDMMRQSGRSFSLKNSNGLVPEAARTRTSMLANDIAAHSNHIVNPLLPNTQAELAVPMITNNQLIGVLDLQADTLNHFNGETVRVMNMLAEQLAIAVENATLFDEVEQARQRQEAVAEQLRAVDNMKSQFLASMSHELRTPLNAILNFTKFVQTGMLGPVNEKQVDALSKTINSSKHLLTLINDVLDITKIESNMLNLFVEEEVNVGDELDTISATAETLLAEKPTVQFVRDYDPTAIPLLVCDKRRVRQILLNLVSNACKFTEDGHVTLSNRVENNQLHITVKDTGPGIPAEDCDLIFEPFRQSRSGLSKGGGTGLGLPIARRLTEAHGGKLWMESTVGQGTTFHVVLPIASSELAELMKTGKAS